MKNILSLVLGVLIGVLGNTVFNSIKEMRTIVFILIIILVVIIQVILFRLEQKSELNSRFGLLIMQYPGNVHGLKFNGICTNHSPAYIEHIKSYFTSKEIEKLNKWKRINNSDLNLIKRLLSV